MPEPIVTASELIATQAIELRSISDKMIRIETLLERSLADTKSLEARVVKLEGFQNKIIGAILLAGAAGGGLSELIRALVGV